MRVKYQITMEVEVDVNPKSKVRASIAGELASRAKMGLDNESFTTNKVEVSRIGATGITPRVVKSKVWGYGGGFNEARYAGQMSRHSFIEQVAKKESVSENWVSQRVCETANSEEVALAKAEPNTVIQI